MKILKWLPVVLVAACPYMILYFLLRLLFDFSGGGLVILLIYHPVWWTGLLCALTVLFIRRLWTPRTLALTNMVVRLAQIPIGGLWSMTVLATFLFGTDPFAVQLGGMIALIFGAPTIILSGILGLAAVLRSRGAGALTTRQAVGYGILQFIFCADIVGSILVYRANRKHKEETV